MNKTSWIVSPAPYLLTRPTVSKMSIVTAISLLPLCIMLVLAGDTAAFRNLALALLGTALAELCRPGSERFRSFADGTALLSGMILGLMLPVTLHPFVAIASSFSGILVARVFFGGTGSYWLSPVATAVSMAFISHPAAFPQALITAEGIQTVGDAFGALKLDHFAQLSGDQAFTGTINNNFLGFFGIKLPEGYVTLFWNSPSVIPAFRYNALLLAGTIILVAMDIIDWIIPLCFLTTYGLIIWFFSLAPFGFSYSGGDVLFSFFTGGIIFIAFYILPEFTTTPRTHLGKILSGIFSGIVAFGLCGPGGSGVGGVFTVILSHSLNPLIEFLENRTIASTGGLA